MDPGALRLRRLRDRLRPGRARRPGGAARRLGYARRTSWSASSAVGGSGVGRAPAAAGRGRAARGRGGGCPGCGWSWSPARGSTRPRCPPAPGRGGARLPARPGPAPRGVRPRHRAGRADHDDGADRRPAAVPVRPAAPPLRAELPRARTGWSGTAPAACLDYARRPTPSRWPRRSPRRSAGEVDYRPVDHRRRGPGRRSARRADLSRGQPSRAGRIGWRPVRPAAGPPRGRRGRRRRPRPARCRGRPGRASPPPGPPAGTGPARPRPAPAPRPPARPGRRRGRRRRRAARRAGRGGDAGQQPVGPVQQVPVAGRLRQRGEPAQQVASAPVPMASRRPSSAPAPPPRGRRRSSRVAPRNAYAAARPPGMAAPSRAATATASRPAATAAAPVAPQPVDPTAVHHEPGLVRAEAAAPVERPRGRDPLGGGVPVAPAATAGNADSSTAHCSRHRSPWLRSSGSSSSRTVPAGPLAEVGVRGLEAVQRGRQRRGSAAARAIATAALPAGRRGRSAAGSPTPPPADRAGRSR